MDEMLDELDTDKDGVISMDEWLVNIKQEKLAGLRVAIEGSLDAATGKIKGYQSLEARLAELTQRRGPLAEELAKIDKQIASLSKTLGSAGLIVFQQIDIDKSGTVEKKELMRVLKVLPKPEGGVPSGPKMSVEDIFNQLDVDGDGTITEDEWLSKLETLPSLKASIEQAVDPETGKIKGYRSLGNQLWKLQQDVIKLNKRIADGEDGQDVAEELEKRKAGVKKLEDKGIEPEPYEM